MPTDSIILVLSCLGVIQAVLLCVYFFSIRDKGANLFLALMLIGLILLIGKSVFDNYIKLEPWIRVLGISGKLMIGPCLLFYGQSLFEKKDFTIRNYINLIPFLLFALLCPVIPNGSDFASYFIATIIFLHLGVYIIICWTYIARHLKGERLLPWYRNIVIGVTLLWAVYMGIFIGFIPIYLLGAVFFSLLIYLFSYLLLKRHVFMLEKYSNSTINKYTSKQLFQQVKELFETKEVYLDCTLSLRVIAGNLAANPRDVSQVINENAQMNFSEFVNHYRIAKAKILLTTPSRLGEKIETIAYDCGFGNITSFNLAFKAETKMTPSHYRNQISLA